MRINRFSRATNRIYIVGPRVHVRFQSQQLHSHYEQFLLRFRFFEDICILFSMCFFMFEELSINCRKHVFYASQPFQ